MMEVLLEWLPSPGWIITYMVLGLFIGFVAGLLGVGGGGIMVPVLTSFYAMQQVPGEQLVHLALGTSMGAIVLTAISSIRSHHKHGAVLWPVALRMTPGVLVGTFVGTWFATYLPTKILAVIFAVFMGYVSLQMALNIKPASSRQLPGSAGLCGAGGVIGGISALVAIGGGSLTVPFLSWCNVTIQKAIATSAAVGLPIALAGSLGYMINGGGEALPPGTVGFVNFPAVIFISGVSFFTAPLGARLTHRLPVRLLKKIFAVLLLGLSLKMLSTVF